MDSLKYSIVNTSTKGRSLFSQSLIAAEEAIFVEKPLVNAQFSWNKAYGYIACDNCMFPLETAEQNIRRLTNDATIILPFPEVDPTNEVHQTAVQCQHCSAKYCSQKCLTYAEKEYHKLLCQQSLPNKPFDEINEIWKKMHYPPETSTVLLVLRIFAIIKTNPEKREAFSDFCDSSVNEDLSICHKILGERFTGQLAELQQAIAQVFAEDEVLHKYLTLDGLTELFAMIGTNSQGIGTSSFAGWVTSVSDMKTLSDQQRQEVDELIETLYATLDETVGQFLNNEGSGLYRIQSKINHSCNPNAEIRFPHSNHILQVVALRNINAGEEICISYLDECQLNRSRHSRQKYLQENYLFLCECEKCQEEIHQPDETSDEEAEEMDTDDDN